VNILVDCASVALEPFVGIQAEMDIPHRVAVMGQACNYWAGVSSGLAWAPSMLPPPGLITAMARVGMETSWEIVLSNSDDQVAKRYRDVVAGSHIEPAEILWAARLAVFTGHSSEAIQLLDRRPFEASDEEFLRATLRRMCDDGTGAWLQSLDLKTVDPLGPVALTARLSAVSRSMYRERDAASLRASLDAAFDTAEAITLNNAYLGGVARARVARYAVPFHVSNRRTGDAADLVRRAVASMPEPATPWRECFLAVEALRRVLDVGTIAALSAKELDLAEEWSRQALELDPACARAHLLAAELFRLRNERSFAVDSYLAAARLGVLEREYAYSRAVTLAEPRQLRCILAEASLPRRGGDLARIINKHSRRLFKADPENPEPPLQVLAAAVAKQAADIPLPIYRQPCQSEPEAHDMGSLLCDRFSSFIVLESPTVAAPLFTQAPLIAFQNLLSGDGGWHRTGNLQRAMVTTFRQELAYALRAAGHLSQMTRLDSWLASGESEGVKKVREFYENVPDLSIFDRVKLGRLLCALGFIEESVQVLVDPPRQEQWSLEETATESMRFFIDSIRELGRGREYGDRLKYIMEHASPDPRSCGLKLGICVGGMVSAARLKDVPQVRYWREIGGPILWDLTVSGSLTEFEVGRATSRFYRAASFLPYLTGDGEALRADMHVWLSTARALRGTTPKERILARENLFPAVESASRTLDYLSDPQAAEALMDEIVQEIDPLDSKAWMQVGDLRLRRGDLVAAAEAFERSGVLAVPLGRISWFKAGRCYSAMSRNREALQCHIKSLELWPTGVSPLMEAQRLADAEGLAVEAACVRRMPAWHRVIERRRGDRLGCS